MEFTAVPTMGSKSHFRRRSPAVSTPLSTRQPKIGGGGNSGGTHHHSTPSSGGGGGDGGGGNSSGKRRFASPLTHPPASKPPTPAVVPQSWAAERIDVDEADEHVETPLRSSSVGSSDDNFEPCLSMSRPRFAAADEAHDHRTTTTTNSVSCVGVHTSLAAAVGELPPLAPQSILQRKMPYASAPSPSGVRRVLVVPDSDSDSDSESESDGDDDRAFQSPRELPPPSSTMQQHHHLGDAAAPRPVPLVPVPTPFTRQHSGGAPRGGCASPQQPTTAAPFPTHDDSATSATSITNSGNTSMNFVTPQSHVDASPQRQPPLDASTKTPTPIKPREERPLEHETSGSPRAAPSSTMDVVIPASPTRVRILDGPQPSEPLGAVSVQAPLPMRRRSLNDVGQPPIANVAAAPSIADQQPDELLVVRRRAAGSPTPASPSRSKPASPSPASPSSPKTVVVGGTESSRPTAFEGRIAATTSTTEAILGVPATLEPEAAAGVAPTASLTADSRSTHDDATVTTTVNNTAEDKTLSSDEDEGTTAAVTKISSIVPRSPGAAAASSSPSSPTRGTKKEAQLVPTLPLRLTAMSSPRGDSHLEGAGTEGAGNGGLHSASALLSHRSSVDMQDSDASPHIHRHASSVTSSSCNAATSTDDLEPRLVPSSVMDAKVLHRTLVDAFTDVPDERQLTPSRSRHRPPSCGSSPDDLMEPDGMEEEASTLRRDHETGMLSNRRSASGGPHYTSKSASFNQPPQEPYLVREPILALVNESLAQPLPAASSLGSKGRERVSASRSATQSNSREPSRESSAGNNSSSGSNRFQTPIEGQEVALRDSLIQPTAEKGSHGSIQVEAVVSPSNYSKPTSPLITSPKRNKCGGVAVAKTTASISSAEATSAEAEEDEFDGLPASLREEDDPSPFRVRCSEGEGKDCGAEGEDVIAVRDALKDCLLTIRESMASQQQPSSPGTATALKRRGSAPLIRKGNTAAGNASAAAAKLIPRPESFYEKIASPIASSIERRRSSRLSKSQDREASFEPPPPLPPPPPVPSFELPLCIDAPSFSPQNTSPVQGPLTCKEESMEGGGVSSEDRATLEHQFQLEDLEHQEDKSIALSFPTCSTSPQPQPTVVVSPRRNEACSHEDDDDDNSYDSQEENGEGIYQPATVRISHAPRLDDPSSTTREKEQRRLLRGCSNEQEDEHALDSVFAYRTPRPATSQQGATSGVSAARIALHNPLPVSNPPIAQVLLGDYCLSPPVAIKSFQQTFNGMDGATVKREVGEQQSAAFGDPAVSTAGRASSPREDESEHPRLVHHVLPLSSVAVGNSSSSKRSLPNAEGASVTGDPGSLTTASALETALAKLSPVPVYPTIFQDIVVVDTDSIEADWKEGLRSSNRGPYRRNELGSAGGNNINKWGLLPCVVVGRQRPADMQFDTHDTAAATQPEHNDDDTCITISGTDARAVAAPGTPQIKGTTNHHGVESPVGTPLAVHKESEGKNAELPMVQLVHSKAATAAPGQGTRQRPITAPVWTPQREQQLSCGGDARESSAIVFSVPPAAASSKRTTEAVSAASTLVEGSSSPTIRIPASPLAWHSKPPMQQSPSNQEDAAARHPPDTAAAESIVFTTSSPHFLRDHHLADVHQRKKTARLLLSPADEADDGDSSRVNEGGAASHEFVAALPARGSVPSFDELAARRREQRLKSIHAALGAIERNRPQRTTSPQMLHQQVQRAAAVPSIPRRDDEVRRVDGPLETQGSAAPPPSAAVRSLEGVVQQKMAPSAATVPAPQSESAFARDMRKVILGLKSSSAVVEGVAALRRQNNPTGTVVPHAYVVAPSE